MGKTVPHATLAQAHGTLRVRARASSLGALASVWLVFGSIGRRLAPCGSMWFPFDSMWLPFGSRLIRQKWRGTMWACLTTLPWAVMTPQGRGVPPGGRPKAAPRWGSTKTRAQSEKVELNGTQSIRDHPRKNRAAYCILTPEATPSPWGPPGGEAQGTVVRKSGSCPLEPFCVGPAQTNTNQHKVTQTSANRAQTSTNAQQTVQGTCPRARTAFCGLDSRQQRRRSSF